MSIKSKLDLELHHLRSYAPAGYFVGLHIRFTSPLMILQTYDEAWVNHYSENAFVVRDPTTIWALGNTGVIRWGDPALPDPYGVFDAARRFGMAYGITCSCGSARSRSIASFSRNDRDYTDAEMESVLMIVDRLHEMTRPADDLTPAQIEALRRIASGDRHAEAAGKLGISESALKARLGGARQRLNARTNAEAIQRAKDYRLI